MMISLMVDKSRVYGVDLSIAMHLCGVQEGGKTN